MMSSGSIVRYRRHDLQRSRVELPRQIFQARLAVLAGRGAATIDGASHQLFARQLLHGWPQLVSLATGDRTDCRQLSRHCARLAWLGLAGGRDCSNRTAPTSKYPVAIPPAPERGNWRAIVETRPAILPRVSPRWQTFFLEITDTENTFAARDAVLHSVQHDRSDLALPQRRGCCRLQFKTSSGKATRFIIRQRRRAGAGSTRATGDPRRSQGKQSTSQP
jgi:hypothetical protein